MAAAAPWTVLVRDKVAQVESSCVYARTRLGDAEATLALPMHVADAEGGRTAARLAGAQLVDASMALSFAANTSRALELLALRGAAADPTDPLPSIEHIPDAHDPERRALGMLRVAREFAAAADSTMAWGSDFLWTAHDLLGRPGLPDVEGFVNTQRVSAHDLVALAEKLAGVSSAFASSRWSRRSSLFTRGVN